MYKLENTVEKGYRPMLFVGKNMKMGNRKGGKKFEREGMKETRTMDREGV
jgi:hypothetical protein